MWRKEIDVDGYWLVIVYYDVCFKEFWRIVKDMLHFGTPFTTIKEIYHMLKSGKAKAVTYNDSRESISFVLLSRHDSNEDYLNSIVHEAEHVKQAMLYAYDVEDVGEPPAYTIGYLAGKIWKGWKERVRE